MFEIVLAPIAQRFYASADRPLARKIARCLTHLEHDPRSGNNVKRLSGEFAEYYRYRIGDWRVVYRVDDEAEVVNVVAIAHRSNVYE